MGFKERIEKNIFRSKRESSLSFFEETTFWLSKELHIPPGDLLEMPIPLVLSLSEQLNEYYKKKAKAQKKAGK